MVCVGDGIVVWDGDDIVVWVGDDIVVWVILVKILVLVVSLFDLGSNYTWYLYHIPQTQVRVRLGATI